MTQSTQYSKGIVLTCGHEGCGCRVRIDEECHCTTGDQAYMCTCGAPLVEVTDTASTTPGTG
jgi:hypothetical protein